MILCTFNLGSMVYHTVLPVVQTEAVADMTELDKSSLFFWKDFGTSTEPSNGR